MEMFFPTIVTTSIESTEETQAPEETEPLLSTFPLKTFLEEEMNPIEEKFKSFIGKIRTGACLSKICRGRKTIPDEKRASGERIVAVPKPIEFVVQAVAKIKKEDEKPANTCIIKGTCPHCGAKATVLTSLLTPEEQEARKKKKAETSQESKKAGKRKLVDELAELVAEKLAKEPAADELKALKAEIKSLKRKLKAKRSKTA